MSQPSENPSSAPAATKQALPQPSETQCYLGHIYWTDADGKEQVTPADEYHRLYKLQESAPKPEASVEPTPATCQDQLVEAAKEEPASGDTASPSSPTPNPSREREGSETCRGPDEGGGEAGRSGVGTGEAGVPTQDWLARGLKHPAGRGWDRDPEASPCGGRDLPQPGASPDGLGPQPALGLTQGQAAPDRFESIRKFGLAARVRFLDCLASHGEVRAAAARAGISHETAYRARRRYADFAQLWDAAMVHARARAESELATRALDGVEVPVVVRGEQVGAWRKHDARYLFAHLARLDRLVEANPAAMERAAHFDELLAAMAGHEAPEDFAEAMLGTDVEGLPPERSAYVAHACSAVLPEPRDEDGEDEEEDAELCPEEEEERLRAEAAAEAEAEAIERAAAEAGEVHDSWREGSLALLDGILEGGGDEGEGGEAAEDASAGDVPLIEYKAMMPGSALRAKLRRSVSHVSTGGSNLSSVRPDRTSVRAEESRVGASLPFVIPAKAGTQLQSGPTGSPLPQG